MNKSNNPPQDQLVPAEISEQMGGNSTRNVAEPLMFHPCFPHLMSWQHRTPATQSFQFPISTGIGILKGNSHFTHQCQFTSDEEYDSACENSCITPSLALEELCQV